MRAMTSVEETATASPIMEAEREDVLKIAVPREGRMGRRLEVVEGKLEVEAMAEEKAAVEGEEAASEAAPVGSARQSRESSSA